QHTRRTQVRLLVGETVLVPLGGRARPERRRGRGGRGCCGGRRRSSSGCGGRGRLLATVRGLAARRRGRGLVPALVRRVLARLLQVLGELVHPLTQVVVVIDEVGQLLFDDVEELIDLVLVVATLADRRLGERDVVHIGWSQRHGIPLVVVSGAGPTLSHRTHDFISTLTRANLVTFGPRVTCGPSCQAGPVRPSRPSTS